MSLRDCLAPGTVVGEFEIRRVLGQGGFGIVYEAYEPMLDRRVALKEYFLQGFSHREGQEVVPLNAESEPMFNSGMSRFIREARLLSMLNERTRADGSLVAVYRVFQANRTACMAMKLYEGQTMRQSVLAAPEQVSEAWLVSLLLRMLDALAALHSLPGENLVHRDVSPDNIILQPDGAPVLLDFGATRSVTDAVTSLIYKPGYSPIEQYTDAIKQGPWTDLYALCGVAYFAITRQSPMPAVDRYAGATFQTASERGAGRFSPEFLALVDHGMAVLPEQRFQRAEDMRAALLQLPSAAAHGGTQAAPLATQALTYAPAPTATFVAPPATNRLSPAEQGLGADEDTTQVHTTAPADPGEKTLTWTATPGLPPRPGATAAAPLPPAPPPPITRVSVAAPLPSPAPPAAAAGRRKALMLGGAALAALVAAVFIVPRIGGGGAGPVKLADAASAPTPPASAVVTDSLPPPPPPPPPPANVPGLACTAAAADWPCVLEGLARLSAQPQGLVLRVTPAEARLGDRLKFDVMPASDGALQLLAVDDTPDGKLTLVFPNALDSRTAVKAGQPLSLPRASWHIEARPPTGRSWMIAVLSDAPLKAPAGLRNGLTLAEAVQAFADQQPLRLLGVGDCTPGTAGCPKTLSIQPADFIIR